MMVLLESHGRRAKRSPKHRLDNVHMCVYIYAILINDDSAHSTLSEIIERSKFFFASKFVRDLKIFRLSR